MARAIRLASAICFAVAAAVSPAAGQRGNLPPCEPPATGERKAAELIDAARCYDDRWQFEGAVKLLASAIVAVESQMAASTGEVIGGGARFVGGDVVTPPLTNRVVGDYPADAALKGVTGIVIVRVTLKTDGSVRTAEVVDSIPALDKAAVDTVKKMRFARTLVAGQPVEVTFFVPTRFGLSAEATPGDWMALARSYLSHGHPAAALQTLSLAMDLERADAERFGGAAPERAGARGVTPPQKISGDQPKYPPHAMAAKVQGLVIIEALIDPAGRVGRARVLKPVAGLESAALDAVQSWRYSPAKLDGKPTTTILVVSVSFQLR